MAEKKGIRFKGHETFTLREGWLNKGLTAIADNPNVFKENYGADALGMGPNMAKALRYWLKCADLIEDISKSEGGGVRLSKAGQLIYSHDRYLEDIFSLWFIHCRIVANRSQATAWNLFFNEFGYEEFQKSEMVREMKELAYLAAEQCAQPKPVADTSVEADCDAILHMYVKKGEAEGTPEEKNVSPFERLELIKNIGGTYVRRQPEVSRLPEDIVLYLLADCLDGRKSMNLDELLDVTNGPGKLLQLERNGLMEILERLQSRDRITVNRTAGLNMIYLNEACSAEKIVEEYYRNR